MTRGLPPENLSPLIDWITTHPQYVGEPSPLELLQLDKSQILQVMEAFSITIDPNLLLEQIAEVKLGWKEANGRLRSSAPRIR